MPFCFSCCHQSPLQRRVNQLHWSSMHWHIQWAITTQLALLKSFKYYRYWLFHCDCILVISLLSKHFSRDSASGTAQKGHCWRSVCRGLMPLASVTRKHRHNLRTKDTYGTHPTLQEILAFDAKKRTDFGRWKSLSKPWASRVWCILLICCRVSSMPPTFKSLATSLIVTHNKRGVGTCQGMEKAFTVV